MPKCRNPTCQCVDKSLAKDRPRRYGKTSAPLGGYFSLTLTPWSEDAPTNCRLSAEKAEEAAEMPDEPIVDAEALGAALESSNSFTTAIQ